MIIMLGFQNFNFELKFSKVDSSTFRNKVFKSRNGFKSVLLQFNGVYRCSEES